MGQAYLYVNNFAYSNQLNPGDPGFWSGPPATAYIPPQSPPAPSWTAGGGTDQQPGGWGVAVGGAVPVTFVSGTSPTVLGVCGASPYALLVSWPDSAVPPSGSRSYSVSLVSLSSGTTRGPGFVLVDCTYGVFATTSLTLHADGTFTGPPANPPDLPALSPVGGGTGGGGTGGGGTGGGDGGGTGGTPPPPPTAPTPTTITLGPTAWGDAAPCAGTGWTPRPDCC